MKNKFYLIPVTEHSVFLNGKPLIEILEDVDKTLYKRENERISMIYSFPMNHTLTLKEKDKINQFNKHTSNLYDIHGVPEKLIVYGNNNGLYELYTGANIECNNINILDIREVDSLMIDYFIKDNPLYGITVSNFINHSRSNIIDFNKAKKLLK